MSDFTWTIHIPINTHLLAFIAGCIISPIVILGAAFIHFIFKGEH